MSNMPTNFTRYRSTDIYIKNESTPWKGTDSGPTAPAGSDFFFAAEVPAMAQAGNYADFSEVGSEIITSRRVLNYIEYTAYDLVFYAKPDTSDNGRVPAEAKLLKSFFGAESGVGTNGAVVYSFSNTMQTHSIWALQKGSKGNHARQLYCAAGSVPTSLAIALAKDGPVTYTMGFQAPRIYYGGTAELDATASSFSNGVVEATIDAPISYSGATANSSNSLFPNMLVGFYDGSNGDLLQDGTGAGLPVASVSDSAGTFSVTSTDITGDLADGVLVQPFLPAMATSVPLMGDSSTAFKVLDQTDVAFFFGGQDEPESDLFGGSDAYKINVTAVNIDMDRGITTPALTEMSGSAFADASYVINEMSISGSATILCRPAELPKLEALRRNPVKSIGLRIKSTAGTIQFYAPAAHFEIPTVSESEGVCQLETSFTVVKGTNTSDANKFKLSYKKNA